MAVADVDVTVTDDDSPGVSISKTALTMSEAAGTDTFDVVLNTEPTDDVTVALTAGSAACTLDADKLTFTAANWETAQTVTVTGVNDDETTGNRACDISTEAGSDDTIYDGIEVEDVAVTVRDDDMPGITVSPTLIVVNRGNGRTVNVVLNTRPTDDVVVTVEPSDDDVCFASETTLTFTSANWDEPQTFIATFLEDADEDKCSVRLLADTETADTNYNGLNPDDVTVRLKKASRASSSSGDNGANRAPLCADFNGTSSAIVRADVPAGTLPNGNVFCRVLIENGAARNADSLAQIGVEAILQRGILQAVDVFGLLTNGVPEAHFAGGVHVCLQGSGTLVYLDATTSPRTISALPVSLENGYVCATLPNAGTLVLVPGTPAVVAPAPAVAATPTGPSEPLRACRVTTTAALRLRAEPNTDSAILTTLPYELTLTATETVEGWYRVVYGDGQGWISADYAETAGDCGQ